MQQTSKCEADTQYNQLQLHIIQMAHTHCNRDWMDFQKNINLFIFVKILVNFSHYFSFKYIEDILQNI